jgi:hypothetical protein
MPERKTKTSFRRVGRHEGEGEVRVAAVVSAIRADAFKTFAARVCLALAFLIACASSRMTKRQAMSLSGAIRSSDP